MKNPRSVSRLLILVGFLISFQIFAESMKYLVVRSRSARYQGPDIPGSVWGPDQINAYRPPYGRVLRGFSLNSSDPKGASWDVLIDDGQGSMTSGRLNALDVATFETQTEAENFSRSLIGGDARLEPVLARVRDEEKAGHGAQARPSIRHSPAPVENTQAARSSITPQATAADARQMFMSLRKKLRSALGNSFLLKLGPGYAPSAEDRRKLISAAESALTADERAAFALIATSWAEERLSVSDPRCQALGRQSAPELLEKCREDQVGRANMLFSMKIIDNRADTRKSNRQYTHKDFWDKSKLDRIWGVVTKDRAFSSWNAGSRNFGNMLSMMLGEGRHMDMSQQISLDRALSSYRDFSSGNAVFRGFEYQGKLATHMINPVEVKTIRAMMKRRAEGLPDDKSIVSWSIERGMKDFKTGVHEVGIRVPSFSVTLPEGEVEAKDMGHWPVYLDNVERRDMDRVRMTQGGW